MRHHISRTDVCGTHNRPRSGGSRVQSWFERTDFSLTLRVCRINLFHSLTRLHHRPQSLYPYLSSPSPSPPVHRTGTGTGSGVDRTLWIFGLIQAEVQNLMNDGAISLHTRSLKYGKVRPTDRTDLLLLPLCETDRSID